MAFNTPHEAHKRVLSVFGVYSGTREQARTSSGLTGPSVDSASDDLLQQHQRQSQREQHAHDDHGDEAHAPEGLALNVGDTEQEAEAVVHAEEDTWKHR